MPRDSRANTASGVRCHLLGLVGANLVVGSLFLWALPLLARLWQPAAPGLLQRLFAPLAAGEGGIGATAVVYGALALAALVVGVVLVIRAARRLGCSG
jgi:hypothetical protein